MRVYSAPLGSFIFKCYILLLVRLARSTLLATLGSSLAFAARLRAFVMRAAASLRKYAILLNFAVEALKSLLERISGIDLDLTHDTYQRDLRSLLRPDLCG